MPLPGTKDSGSKTCVSSPPLKEAQDHQKYVQSWQFAKFYAALDEKDLVFEWLDRAYEAREGSSGSLKVNPQFDNLRDDPRFQDLLLRIDFGP